MATLDDTLTTQKNGVIAINNLNQTLTTFQKNYAYAVGQYTSDGISATGAIISLSAGRLVSINTIVAGTGASVFNDYLTYPTISAASSSGTATIGYSGGSTTTPTFAATDTVIISGVVPTGFNTTPGSTTSVSASPAPTTTAFSFTNSTSGTQTVAGTVFNLNTANKIAAAPTTIGTYQIGAQFSYGLYVVIGTGQTISITYSLG